MCCRIAFAKETLGKRNALPHARRQAVTYNVRVQAARQSIIVAHRQHAVVA